MIKRSVTWQCDVDGCTTEATAVGVNAKAPEGWLELENKNRWDDNQQCICPSHVKLRKQVTGQGAS